MAVGVDQLLGILSKSEEGENAASVEAEVEDDKPKSISAVVEERPAFTRRSAFTLRDSHPVVLDLILIDLFGPQWLSWDPEVIWSEIESELGVDPGVHARNKINAVKTLHLVDTPWSQWEVLSVVIQAFADNIPDFRTLQRPTPYHIVPSVGIINKIKKKEFSDEVGRFTAACFLDDGVYYLPSPVEFAQVHATAPRYKCTRCGNIDSDEDNEVCDLCGAPDRFLEKTLRSDSAPVKARYEKVVKDGESRDYWLAENLVDVQVAKLMLAKSRNDEANVRLRDQLKAVKNG